MTQNAAVVEISQDTRPGYPDGVFAMAILQLLMMVGFTVILALLVLYCTRRLGMPVTKAYGLFAAYNALVFAASVFGGYLGERYLGYRYAVILSIILSAVGLFLMMIHKVSALYWGLAFFTIATAIWIPCSYVLLGRLYDLVDDPRRDSGFTIAYIGMNVGSFFASVMAGYIANFLGYGLAFFIGGVFTVLSLILFLVYKALFKRRHPDALHLVKTRVTKTSTARLTGLFLVAISIPATMGLLNFANMSNLLMLVLGVFSVGLVIYLSRQEVEHYRKKLIAFLILTVISVAFWALYTIGPSALTIFVARNVNREFFGSVIPAASYTALNPFFIITIGPVLTLLWMYLNKRGKKISTPTKFALGLVLMGLGYLVLVFAITTHGHTGRISSWWIILSYFFQTVGELFVGPIGFSMVGELVPPRLEGLMMGIWQLAAGVAGAISQYMADMTTTPVATKSALATDPTYSHAFLWFGLVTLIIGTLTFVLVPYLKRMIDINNDNLIA